MLQELAEQLSISFHKKVGGANGTGGTAPSGANGTGGTALPFSKSIEKLTKPYQDPPGDSRTHPGSTRDAPGARRTTFYFISQQSQAPTPRAGPDPPED